MRRACLFSFYDKDGIVDDYIVYFLKELSKHAERIIFFSNGKLDDEQKAKILPITEEIKIRPNEGFDVMAYKEACSCSTTTGATNSMKC